MSEESSTYNEQGVSSDGSPLYDEYLPGPIQVLVEWLILIVSTLWTFFQRKGNE
ncbi:MAG: hypothetical protein IJK89_04115 [Clostridia bacterium]|nr:hypothetical protein [Clostridia bacterium]